MKHPTPEQIAAALNDFAVRWRLKVAIPGLQVMLRQAGMAGPEEHADTLFWLAAQMDGRGSNDEPGSAA